MSPQPDREVKEKLIVSGLLIFTTAAFLYFRLISTIEFWNLPGFIRHGAWLLVLCIIALIVGIGFRISENALSWKAVIVRSILLGISLPMSSFWPFQIYDYELSLLSPIFITLLLLFLMRIESTD